MRGSTSVGYDQFETSPEAIEQELRPAVCERRPTDRLKANYSIDDIVKNKISIIKFKTVGSSVRPFVRSCGTSLVRWMALQCANRTASRLAKRIGSLLYVRCRHRSAKSTAVSNKTILFQVTHIYLFRGSVTLST